MCSSDLKRTLYLSSARLRRVWGELKAQMPSRFLDDIPPACFALPRRAAGAMAVAAPPPRAPVARKPRRSYDEFDQRTYDDDVPVIHHDDDGGAGFAPGAAVRHRSFGRGRVVSSHGSGLHQRVVVEFPGVDPSLPVTRTIDARWLARD